VSIAFRAWSVSTQLAVGACLLTILPLAFVLQMTTSATRKALTQAYIQRLDGIAINRARALDSHNASVISFGRYLHRIPKDRNIVVVCSTGIDAFPIAYALHKRGYRSVAILLGGIVGWQLQQPKLYQRLGGKNITKIEPRGRSRNA
jgi:rhodanese-related sulfurtransferase